MDLRNEVFSHSEKLWVLCIGQESLKKPLAPLFDMIDWYNNQLITKSLLENQITVEFGSKTLLATTGFLPVSRLLVMGIGDEKSLSDAHGKTLLTNLAGILEGLGESSPWVILPSAATHIFLNETQKTKTKFDRLAGSAMSVS